MLLLATALFTVGAALNLYQRATQPLPPTDGVFWVQKADGVYAKTVQPGSAADRAQILPGDKLLFISFDGKNFEEIVSPADIQIYLDQAKVDGSLTYFYQRPSYSFSNNYYADLSHIGTNDRWNAPILLMTFVGLVYLAVGLFVFFKQGGSVPFILHFAALCLTAFVFHVYRQVGTGQDADLAIGLIDQGAFIIFAPLFVHFCLRYPVRSQLLLSPPVVTYLLYLPGVLLTGTILFFSLSYLVLPQMMWEPIGDFADRFNVFANLDLLALLHFIAGIVIGSQVLLWRFFKSKQAVVRQRLKWAVWGTIGAALPSVTFQLAKSVFGLPDDGWYSALVILPMALIPLTFGHSVIRYRLMDVDVVVRRALVYAATTIALAMMIGSIALALMFLAIGNGLSSFEITLRVLVAVIAMAVIVMISEPIKNFLQERVDRYFYGERYDLRRGLMDFGRTLSATTAMEPLLNALVSRLQQVLNVEKVAVFIENETDSEHYHVARSAGLNANFSTPGDFRQMIRTLSAQRTVIRADELYAEQNGEEDSSDNLINGNGFNPQELHYYVPCVVRGRMVAVIGLGRAIDGSLLSSEDIDILHTVSGFVAVAIENSLLYQEQRDRAEELAQLKEFNESIVESVNVGLLAVDQDGRVRSCNTTFEDLFGISRAEAVGHRVENLFDENFAGSLTRLLGRKTWHLTEIRNAYKLFAQRRTGEALTLNVAIAPLRSPASENNGAIIVLEDVSSRLKLEEQLQQREKLSSIGLLAAGVAHEVNTPLTGVSSYTQMLLGMLSEDDPKHALLTKVHKQTERASNIVNNLLNFSRAGGSAEFTELNLNSILEDTIQLLEVQLRHSEVALSKDYDEDLPGIFGNAGKLQQVFTNLILNARDAMPTGGKISLQTRMTGDGVEITVSDTGQGISPENLTKIYDPFFTTKEVGEGTGLGLAVSYGIIQEHSGDIKVESRIGEGTTFRLLFPAAQPITKRQAAGS
jgi:two-component system NtrC family sensor kinase